MPVKRSSSPKSWATIVEKEEKKEKKENAAGANATIVKAVVSSKRRTIKNVVEGVPIEVYMIDSPQDCHRYLGWWCYCQERGRYYTSLNGTVVKAAPTIIRPSIETPNKFHEDRRCNAEDSKRPTYESLKDSTFYVPPELIKGSKDVRELTNRMVYSPTSDDYERRNPYVYRLGSSDHLRTDLSEVSESDFRLQMDINGWGTLIITLANLEMKKRGYNKV